MDHRDVMAHTPCWYRRLDEERMLAFVDLDEYCEDEDEDEAQPPDTDTTNMNDSELYELAYRTCQCGLCPSCKDRMNDEDEDGEGDGLVAIPFLWEVCETCNGKGSHVNPSIDSHGITSSEWAEWDEDEREGYFRGRYDVTCYECNGLRVVPEPDYKHIPPKLAKRLEEYIFGCASYGRELCHEMEMGY